MDVYGGPTWQLNQSDDLVKQVYAQQALAPYNYNRNLEGHAMPTPSPVPWNMVGLPWSMPQPQPSLVQFTGQEMGKFNPGLHCKRKPADIEPEIPAKQLITEEKMAEHLNGLHISTQYRSHTTTTTEWAPSGSAEWAPMETMEVTDRENKPKLVLSDELKRLRDEPLLPAALIERLQKPCLSLVVWKPRENVITNEEEEEDRSKEKEEKRRKSPSEATTRTGVLVQDLPSMDVEM